MDRLAILEAFVGVAETKSFSQAAQRLRISKSAVSRQVAALEADLGVRLFHRTTRSLTLTEAGQGYYAQVSRILADLEDADSSVCRLQASPRGRLKISAPMSFGVLHLAPAIPDFLHRFPEIEADLSMSDRYVDLVEEGFDLAIRIGRLEDSSLIARRLAPIRMTVCASPEYLEERGAPAHPRDLSGHDCLCYTLMSDGAFWDFSAPGGAPLRVAVKGRMRADNGDALKVAALKGLGLCYLPTFIVGADLQSGALASVLTEFMPSDVAAHAIYPTARLLSPKVRAFVDFLTERFGDTPYWDLVA